MLPVELTKLPLLEKLFLDNNKLTVLPPELGVLKNLKVLTVDYNMLVSVPGTFGTCVFHYSFLRRSEDACNLFLGLRPIIACDSYFISCLTICS